MEHTQITRLCKRVQEHLSELAHIANTMAHEVTHYAIPAPHVTYVHAYHTITMLLTMNPCPRVPHSL